MTVELRGINMARRRILTQQEEDNLCRQYEKNKKIYEVMKDLNVSESTAYRAIRRGRMKEREERRVHG